MVAAPASPYMQGRNFLKIIGVAFSLFRVSFVPHHAIGVMLNIQIVGVVATTRTYIKVPPMHI